MNIGEKSRSLSSPDGMMECWGSQQPGREEAHSAVLFHSPTTSKLGSEYT
jgi:hypothetical protein